jgi:hypothetical protein
MPTSIMMVFANPTSPEDDEEFNRWYSSTHLGDIAGLPGVTSARRFRIQHDVETIPGVGGAPQRYIAIYELQTETEEGLAAFTEALRRAVEAGTIGLSPTMDMTTISAVLATPIGEPVLPV